MSLEFIKINNDGVNTKSFDELTNDEKIDLELAILVDDVKMLCVNCLVEIPKGSGFFCNSHIPK
jgi:hypothetical protein